MKIQVEVTHRFPEIERLIKESIAMGDKTNAAVAALVAEVTDSKGKLESLKAAVLNFPNVVAGAVADALAAANVDDATAAAAIDQARTEISDEVDGVLAAADLNPAPEDTGGTGADEPPAAEEPPADEG
jgi:hypothetical protein